MLTPSAVTPGGHSPDLRGRGSGLPLLDSALGQPGLPRGCIPSHRRDLEKAKQSLDIARQRLEPGADILPFTIRGLYGYNRKGSFQLTPKPVRVAIGPAIPYSRFSGMTPEQLSDHVRGVISELWG